MDELKNMGTGRDDEITAGERRPENRRGADRGPGILSRIWRMIVSLVKIAVAAAVIVIGYANGNIKSTYCGDDSTRLLIYASGTTSSGVEYKSLVGPAGLLGFGINSKLWPTECVSVKTSASGKKVSGCVSFYNEAGCIDKSAVKSEGKYSEKESCLGMDCTGTNYVESTAESTRAKEQMTCMGSERGEANAVPPRYYNDDVPRQFPEGCWGKEKME